MTSDDAAGVRGHRGRGPAAAPAYPTFADGHDVTLVGEALARSAATGASAAVLR